MSTARKPVWRRSRRAPHDPDAAARAVREMFTSIAPRYDLLNHVLSFNVDRLWWRRTARAFAHILAQPDSRVLDLCCGTGDMTFALRKQAGNALRPQSAYLRRRLFACHAAARPEQVARQALNKQQLRSAALDRSRRSPPSVSRPALRSRDLSLRLPQSSRLRCRPARDRARSAPRRRVRHPRFQRTQRRSSAICIVSTSSRFSRASARLLSGVRGPYAYLPNSVERFPDPEEMKARMLRAGFSEASWTPYTFGIAGLYRGKK